MKNQIIQGKIQGNERGYGFLIPDNGMEDYFIPHGDLRDAQHGDTVLCQTTVEFNRDNNHLSITGSLSYSSVYFVASKLSIFAYSTKNA